MGYRWVHDGEHMHSWCLGEVGMSSIYFTHDTYMEIKAPFTKTFLSVVLHLGAFFSHNITPYLTFTLVVFLINNSPHSTHLNSKAITHHLSASSCHHHLQTSHLSSSPNLEILQILSLSHYVINFLLRFFHPFFEMPPHLLSLTIRLAPPIKYVGISHPFQPLRCCSRAIACCRAWTAAAGT